MDWLDRLLVFQPRWDGWKTPPLSRDAIEFGQQVLSLGRREDYAQVRVVPYVEGGVAVYFFGGGCHAEGGWNRHGAILITNDGKATLYLRDRSRSDAGVVEIAANDVGLRLAVERVGGFLARGARGVERA